jgi:hypothetical protein
MADRNQNDRDILADVARIAAGFGVLAAAALGAVAARKRGPTPDEGAGTQSLNDLLRNRPAPRRKPPEAGVAVPAVPPRGPLPRHDGAAAPLNFERD